MKAIVAIDKLWGIGKDGDLLFKIKEDMKFFNKMTTGKVVVMGRKTFESLPDKKPLKDRINLIITTSKDYDNQDNLIFGTIDEINEIIKKYDTNDIYIIGGESVYKQFIDRCDTVYISHISKRYEADKYMPNLAFEGFMFKNAICGGYLNDKKEDAWWIEEWIAAEYDSYKSILWYQEPIDDNKEDYNTVFLYANELNHWHSIYSGKLRVLTDLFRFKLIKLNLKEDPFIYKLNNYYRAETNRHCNYKYLRIAAFGATEEEAKYNLSKTLNSIYMFN